MLLKKLLRKATPFLLLIVSLIACEDLDDELVDSVNKLEITPTLEAIRSRGYADSVIEDHGDHYVVEGDIRFNKDTQYALSTEFTKGQRGGRIEQQRTGSIVSQTEITNVTIGIRNGIMPTSGPDDWRVEIQQAINDWNSTPDNIINFVYVGDCPTASSCADVVIQWYMNLTGHLCEGATPSVSGMPGNSIEVNPIYNKDQTLSSSVKRRAIVHALGHTIGFYHGFQWTTGPGSEQFQIQGTPCGDSNSVMWNESFTSWTGFSSYDIVAAQSLYPTPHPEHGVGTVPFFRYRANFGIGDHFYTWNWAEIGCGAGADYWCEGTEGYLFTSSQPGTVPIHRYNNGSDHFYTRFQTTYAGYNYEQIAGYAYASSTSGTIPIHRYVGPGNDHFYTKVQYSYPNYTYEGVAWYAYP